MAWLDEAIERLMARPVCGYRLRGSAERSSRRRWRPWRCWPPTAAARRRRRWIGSSACSPPDGSLGIDAQRASTLLADGLGHPGLEHGRSREDLRRQGRVVGRGQAGSRRGRFPRADARRQRRGDQEQLLVGHDTTLQGWPWVVGTHSWVEPTAINVLALRSAGQAGHPRCREAVKLLLDRQLPEGGWNYGNTTVLGHVLRPQVQPTGLALAALAGETDVRSKVQRFARLSPVACSRGARRRPRSVMRCWGWPGTAFGRSAADAVACVGVAADRRGPRLALRRGPVGPGGKTVVGRIS